MSQYRSNPTFSPGVVGGQVYAATTGGSGGGVLTQQPQYVVRQPGAVVAAGGGGGAVAASDAMAEPTGFLKYVDIAPRHRQKQVQSLNLDGQNVLGEQALHHGDFHHHHVRRHVHHFHDVHILGGAEEVMDLSEAPQVVSKAVPAIAPPQFRLRPELIGEMAWGDASDFYMQRQAGQHNLQAPVVAAAPVQNLVAGGGTAAVVATTPQYVTTGGQLLTTGTGGQQFVTTNNAGLAYPTVGTTGGRRYTMVNV